ncbi:hypothetical protein PBI_JACE_71 [Gordonia phage Jace]|uniref:Uncharacterized protein n=1 Tax=Gordonia phage Jace TaxID=2182360 RepID=A0A2U8UJG4_9CAUD|nr:hypothetical protein HOT28_gp71 [Gordonia phage Jace]AWN03691.1 hypothetical protein PBI_JACE_71 [Gordonia phage Jace]
MTLDDAITAVVTAIGESAGHVHRDALVPLSTALDALTARQAALHSGHLPAPPKETRS